MVGTFTCSRTAASSGRLLSGARRVTVSASSRCELVDSPGKTFKDGGGDANTERGKAEPGNFSWDTRSSRARSGSGAEAECKRAGNTRCESRKKKRGKDASNTRGDTQGGRTSRCGCDVPVLCKSGGR